MFETIFSDSAMINPLYRGITTNIVKHGRRRTAIRAMLIKRCKIFGFGIFHQGEAILAENWSKEESIVVRVLFETFSIT
jgi:hypothetical protein